MKNIFLFSLFFLILFGCKKTSEFKILKRYDESTVAYFVYTNSKDSIEILNYSETLMKTHRNMELVFIYFCDDSTKTPIFYKGKVDYVENSFACYSNIHEKYYGINSLGQLVFVKEHKH